MASACVNSNVSVSPDGFPSTFTSYPWLSPRVSLSRDDEGPKSAKPSPSPAVNGDAAIKFPTASSNIPPQQQQPSSSDESSDPEISGADFEFCLENPVNILPADELFADGKLMPLQLKPSAEKPEKVSSPEKQRPRRINELLLSSTSSSDPSAVFSPKAPRCSSRWKELLGLRKGSGNTPSAKENIKTATANSKFKYFLHRKSSSSSDVSLTSPLLRDSECESLSLQSSRLSLSSSSSEDINMANPILPSRHSLDSDKPVKMTNMHPPRLRLVNNNNNGANINNGGSSNSNGGSNRGVAMRRAGSGEGLTADSPRMNASGKIVFGNGTSLERSSSSPSPGGPRFNHRGMERSYSANVRIAPVLNVPVCSLRSSNGTGVFKFFGGSSSTTGSSSSSQRRDSSLMRNNNKTDYRTVI